MPHQWLEPTGPVSMSQHPWLENANYHPRQSYDADAALLAADERSNSSHSESSGFLAPAGAPSYLSFYGTDMQGPASACDPSISPMQLAAPDGYYVLHPSVFTTQPSAAAYGLEGDYPPPLAGWDRMQPAASTVVEPRPPRIKRHSSDSSLGSNSGGRPVVKRSRMGCLTCRLRKKRCSETRPRCAECSRLGLSCEWPKPGTEYKNRPRDQKDEDKTIHHEIYGKIKVLRGIVEHRTK